MEYHHEHHRGSCCDTRRCAGRRSAGWASGIHGAFRFYGADLSVGSLIYVKDVDYKELEAGDVITFMLDEDTVATHRITEVVPDEEEPDTLRYRTKGDANDAEDGKLVHYKNVIGSPVFTIPYLGYFADYIQNPPGTYVAISVGAVLLLLVFLPDLFSSDDKDKEKKKTKGRYERDHIPKQ